MAGTGEKPHRGGGWSESYRREHPEQFNTPKTEIVYHKNGFEMRSEILDIAADFVKWEFEYKVKLGVQPLAVPSYKDVLQAAIDWNDFLKDCTNVGSGRNTKTFLREEKE